MFGALCIKCLGFVCLLQLTSSTTLHCTWFRVFFVYVLAPPAPQPHVCVADGLFFCVCTSSSTTSNWLIVLQMFGFVCWLLQLHNLKVNVCVAAGFCVLPPPALELQSELVFVFWHLQLHNLKLNACAVDVLFGSVCAPPAPQPQIDLLG